MEDFFTDDDNDQKGMTSASEKPDGVWEEAFKWKVTI